MMRMNMINNETAEDIIGKFETEIISENRIAEWKEEAANANARADEAVARADRSDARADEAVARADRSDARADKADAEVIQLKAKIKELEKQLNNK